ncbi:MAG: phosphatidylserine decarboxylase family protein [Bacteroidales bacterium]|nr:phosphatidylserine decarboxylase family protein [Bacteroidales bacterium]
MRYSIHKEGISSIAWMSVCWILIVLLAFFSGGWVLWSLSVAGFLFWLAVLSFFRIPRRDFPDKDAGVVFAPADGKVVDIAEVEEQEYFGGVCTKVSIFMSPANVHVNRYPVSGKVMYCKYHPGRFLVAWHEKSSHLNEHNTVVVRTDAGVDVLVRQIAGAVARRIVSYAREGSEVDAMSELGFIKFGSRVDLFFPVGTLICVKMNEKVKGGISRLAVLTEGVQKGM